MEISVGPFAQDNQIYKRTKGFASEVAYLAIVLICSGQVNQIVIQNYQGKREFFNLMTKCIYEIEYESQGIDAIHLKNTETT